MTYIAIALGIMIVKLLIDYTATRFYQKKFDELINNDKEKALNIMFEVVTKEILKIDGQLPND